MSPEIIGCEEIDVKVIVKNEGPYGGDEVVQVYVSLDSASVSTANIRLADFARVHLSVGETREVSLRVAVEQRSVVLDDGTMIAEPTIVSVFVGGGQPRYAPHVAAKVVVKGSPARDCY